VDDLVISEHFSYVDGMQYAGEVHVYFGRRGQAPDPTRRVPDVIFYGDEAGAKLGISVARAGDVNGDGIGDLLVAGEGDATYVVFGSADNSNHLVYQYWKTGMTEPSTIISTGTQNDFWGVALNVFGTTLRVATHYYVSGEDDVIRITSSADGTTWSAPLGVPNDGGQSPGDRLAMATGPLGQTAISYEVAGGNLTGTQCSEPKLARSTGFTLFSTCSPDDTGFSADYPALAFTSTNKLLFAFQNSSDSHAANGVYVYLEP
jgi:hypothetical protein